MGPVPSSPTTRYLHPLPPPCPASFVAPSRYCRCKKKFTSEYAVNPFSLNGFDAYFDTCPSKNAMFVYASLPPLAVSPCLAAKRGNWNVPVLDVASGAPDATLSKLLLLHSIIITSREPLLTICISR